MIPLLPENPEDIYPEDVKGRTITTKIADDGRGNTIHHHEAIPGMGVCDFCSGPGPFHSHDAGAIVFGTIIDETGRSRTDTSHDPWAACSDCHQDILSDDREALVKRSVENALINHPEVRAHRALIEAEIRRVHSQFFDARK